MEFANAVIKIMAGVVMAIAIGMMIWEHECDVWKLNTAIWCLIAILKHNN